MTSFFCDQVQPAVTVLGAAAQWARARAWRDDTFEAADPANMCVHVVVASVNDVPATFTIAIDGLCGAGSSSQCLPTHNSTLNATHLFNEFYTVPATPTPAVATTTTTTTTHTITDVLMPGSTAIYAIGCDAWTTDVSNLVNDPGFEATQFPLTAGFLTCKQEAQFPKGTYKGKCNVEDKHAGSWGLPQKQVDRDNRAQLYIDSRLPHSGRHSARIWLPAIASVPVVDAAAAAAASLTRRNNGGGSGGVGHNGNSAGSRSRSSRGSGGDSSVSARLITFGMPGHTTNIDGVPIANSTQYAVELFARSCPPGLQVQVSVGGWITKAREITSPLGEATYMEYTPATYGAPSGNLRRARGVNGSSSSSSGSSRSSGSSNDVPVKLSGNWTKVTVVIPAREAWPAGSTFNLRVGGLTEGGYVAGGGSVWIDDVAIRKISQGE